MGAFAGEEAGASRRRELVLAVALAALLCAPVDGRPPETAVAGSDLSGRDLAAASDSAMDTLATPQVEVSPAVAADRQIITWKDRFASGKDKVAVDVYQPVGRGVFPVVVLLHGAGPRKADKHYQRLAESLAENGYLSLYVHYYDRGRKGRGSRSQWSQAVSDALTFASRLESADSERIGVVGYSLGAFLALGRGPKDDRIRAVVAYYGGISRGEPEGIAERMPPTLLFHGTADRIVPVRRSVEAFEVLKQEGRPVDLVVYPGARHGFCLNGRTGVDGQAAEDSWNRALAFFAHHLKAADLAPVLPPAFTLRDATTSLGGAIADTWAEPPDYLEMPRPGVDSTVTLINPDAATVLSLVPKKAPRARAHRTARGNGATRPASVKLPARTQ